jgi:hypothetical protein
MNFNCFSSRFRYWAVAFPDLCGEIRQTMMTKSNPSQMSFEMLTSATS